MKKLRLSASVDEPMIQAAEDAVARGRAPNVSAWVNDAMRLKVEHDRKLEALGDFVAAYEAKHGEITEEEMRRAARKVQRAVAVADKPRRTRRPR